MRALPGPGGRSWWVCCGLPGNYRRPWDHAIAVCADYQGPYQGVARNISIAETKRNPEPPTFV